MSGIKVGDRVEIVTYRTWDEEYNGFRGVVHDIDTDDIPYHVELDGGEGRRVWAVSVALLDGSASSDREALVTRAKELLAGTEHTGADVVAMATFLAGQ
jgi:hypothetical protein